VFSAGEDDVLEVAHGSRVAVASYHVLGAAGLHNASAGVAVTGSHRFDNAADRQPIGSKAVGVDVHLVLAHVPAERRHVGHPANRFQVITEIPVLVRP